MKPHWDKIPLPSNSFICTLHLGNGNDMVVVLARHNNNHLSVGIEGVGCYTFCRGVSIEDVMHVYDMTDYDSAKNLSDFINAQLEVENFRYVGEYLPDCCL